MLDRRGRQKNAGRPDSPKRVDKKVREKRNPESCWAGAGGSQGVAMVTAKSISLLTHHRIFIDFLL